MRIASMLLVALLVLAGCSHYPGGLAPSTIHAYSQYWILWSNT